MKPVILLLTGLLLVLMVLAGCGTAATVPTAIPAEEDTPTPIPVEAAATVEAAPTSIPDTAGAPAQPNPTEESATGNDQEASLPEGFPTEPSPIESDFRDDPASFVTASGRPQLIEFFTFW